MSILTDKKTDRSEYYKKWVEENAESVKRYKHEWYLKNKQLTVERAKQWVEKNKEKARELCRQRNKRWREKDLEKSRERERKWDAMNRESRRASHKKYMANHPEKFLDYTRKRRAKKRNAIGGHFTHQEFVELCHFYGDKCLRCGRKDVKLYPDHVVPLGPPHSDEITNIQPLCNSCNSKKHTKTIDYR